MTQDLGLEIGVVGATGAVGREMLATLERRGVSISRLELFASADSRGVRISYEGRSHAARVLEPGCFEGLDVVLFSAGAERALEWAPRAAAAGALVIDNSSAFRSEADVPLVVPEVNPEALRGVGPGSIVANPNCSTIQLVMALQPLHAAFGLKRLTVATYQSVSGAGQKGIKELSQQVVALLNYREVEVEAFAHPIGFNVLPHAGSLEAEHSSEELKVVQETRRLLGLSVLPISVTCARVPVFSCHAEAVHMEFEVPVKPAEARKLLRGSAGIEVRDDPASALYPTPREASGRDEVFVGRIREDLGVPGGLAMWVVADNLRKGAALNAVQIMEMVIEMGGMALSEASPEALS